MRKPRRKAKDVFDLIESKMSASSIARSDAKARKMILALRLAEFRKAIKKDQSAVKGFSQPAVSKIEARGDIRLSTLIDYCKGLGAEIRITAHRPADKGKRKPFLLLET